jgi:hypothetical protein
MNDPDLTPKANERITSRPGTSRTISAGDFLKHELYRSSTDIEGNEYSTSSHDHERTYNQERNFSQPLAVGSISPHEVLERRSSRSKNFFLRAIGVRHNDDQPRRIQKRAGSAASRGSLTQHISRNKLTDGHRVGSLYLGNGRSYSSQSKNIGNADVGVDTRTSSYNDIPLTPSPCSSPPSTGVPSAFVLCPQITITPEVASVETGICTIWVAILITGALQRADGYRGDGTFEQSFNDQLLGLSKSLYEISSMTNFMCPDFASYGRLHNMRIELLPGPGCQLIELVGDLHTATAMQVGGTRLIAAKICLNKAEPSLLSKDTISDSLMAELEHDLGHTISPFIKVRLSYRHSGFPQLKKSSAVSEGLISHVTNLQTEATAVIKRHNLQSAWSPRTSQTIELPMVPNPVINLIETHLPADQAREALRRLATERAPIPLAKRFQHFDGSSDETIRPCSIAGKTTTAISTSPIQVTSRAPQLTTHTKMTSSPLAAIALAHTARDILTEEVDPARKIWTEMRRYSRGGRSQHRREGISADHYNSFTDDCSPSRISSGQLSDSSINSADGAGSIALGFQHERSRIMEVALRNKRSVGADTLRSIAPSVLQSVEKKSGISGVGLGVGRSWGWGHSWW